MWSTYHTFETYETRDKQECSSDYVQLRDTAHYPSPSLTGRLFSPSAQTIANFHASSIQTNQLAVITGVHPDSVGLHVAQELAATAGMHVVLLGKSLTNLKQCRASILQQQSQRRSDSPSSFSNNKIYTVKYKISSFESILEASNEIKEIAKDHHDNRLSLLVNLATVGTDQPRLTEDGLEYNTGCNFIGTHLFTRSLMKLLQATPRARVITASSMGHCLGSNFVPQRLVDCPQEGGAPPGFIHQKSTPSSGSTALSCSQQLLEAPSIVVDASDAPQTKLELQRGVQKRGTQVGRSKFAQLADTLHWSRICPSVSFIAVHLVPQSQHSNSNNIRWNFPWDGPGLAAAPFVRAAMDDRLPSGTYLHSDGQPWHVQEPADDPEFGKRCHDAAEQLLAQSCPRLVETSAASYEPPKLELGT